MAKVTPKEQAPAKPERLIYCGPSLPGGILQQHTIFKGGLPEYLQTTLAKCPSIKALFVTPAKLAATQTAIRTPGTPENLHYREIISLMEKGGLKHGV